MTERIRMMRFMVTGGKVNDRIHYVTLNCGLDAYETEPARENLEERVRKTFRHKFPGVPIGEEAWHDVSFDAPGDDE